MTDNPNRSITRLSKLIKSPRKAVYEACLDPIALASWRVPDIMTGHIHGFDARVGGGYRMSLIYDSQAHPAAGKTSAHADIFEGKFIELVPYEKIVEIVTFESTDPKFTGDMTITTMLADADGETVITIVCEDIPRGIRPEDNEAGTRQSLEKLAARFVGERKEV